MRVQDVMTTEVATARPDTSLKDVARELAERGISGMPVVDGDSAVVGVISEADILAKSLSEPEDDARVVRDAMTAPAVTIEGHWPVAEAAEQMLTNKVNRLPVVRQGRLVGVVSRADLVRAFARSDDEMAGEIRDIVALQQELWRDERTLEITVEHGEVSLAGEVLHRDEAEVLGKMVQTVPGVVGVRTELTWIKSS
jgi:CBS domain-containing protein